MAEGTGRLDARNVIANGVGTIGRIALSVGTLLIVFALLGAERYGLVAFYQTLAVLGIVLDFGLTRTLRREIALSGSEEDADRTAAGLMTAALLAIGAVAVLIIAGVTSAAPWIANQWLELSAVSVSDARAAITLMGVALALQSIASVFGATLEARFHQVATNILGLGLLALRSVASVGALLWFGPDIVVYFLVAVACGAIDIVAVVILHARRLTPAFARPRFGFFSSYRRFGIPEGISNAIGFLLIVADRMILSGLLPLADFGIYGLASNIAALVLRFPSPITAAMFPRFTGHIASGDGRRLEDDFRTWAGVTAALVAGAVVAAITMGKPAVEAIKAQALPEAFVYLVAILCVGNALNALCHLPHTRLLARGRSAILMWVNVVSLPLYGLYLVLSVPLFGWYGAAAGWLLFGLYTVGAMLIYGFRAELAGSRSYWFIFAVIAPVSVSCFVAAVLSAWPITQQPIGVLLIGIVASGIAAAVVAVVQPALRKFVL